MRDFDMQTAITSIEAGRVNPPDNHGVETIRYCDCDDWIAFIGEECEDQHDPDATECPFCEKELEEN